MIISDTRSPVRPENLALQEIFLYTNNDYFTTKGKYHIGILYLRNTGKGAKSRAMRVYRWTSCETKQSKRQVNMHIE